MKQTGKRILLVVGLVIAVLGGAAIALFWNELSTLASFQKADAHPLYTMTYRGDYGFSDFLKTGAESDRDIERFVIKRLLKGVDIDLGITSAGCSAFTAQNQNGERIFARNFDFDFAPAMLLKTTPSDGYASISIVNLAFAGYDRDFLPDSGLFDRFLTLAAPFLPFDGMNEKGVVIALLAVPHAEPPDQPGRVKLNTTTAIRMILDHAASVEEALALLDDYNLYFSGDVECHYLISDRAGDSAVAEFLEGEIKITTPDKNHQIATNFIQYQGRNEGEGGTEFERYATIERALLSSGGVIDETAAMQLLSDASIPGRTQWSVVYNQSTGQVTICMGEQYGQVYSYQLERFE